MIFGSGTHETTRLCMEEIEMNEEWTVIGMSEGVSDEELDSVINEILGM